MIPIPPPPLLNQGIAVYSPPIQEDTAATIRCQIFYSFNNPIFNWVLCDNSTVKIWDDINAYSETGTLFLYRSTSELKPGFYTISVSIYKKSGGTISGKTTIGVTRYKDKLVIGMPFSAYGPITLS